MDKETFTRTIEAVTSVISGKPLNEGLALELNKILEKMISKDPSQWILTHNRWKS